MNKEQSNSRRDFLKMAGMASIGFMGLQYFVNTPAAASTSALNSYNFGYGPLLPDPKGILSLPKGFSYKVISRTGDPMSDGLFVPGAPDGMATFQGPKGRVILVRNHELQSNSLSGSPFGAQNELLSKVDKDKFYDFGKGVTPELGGTTTVSITT